VSAEVIEFPKQFGSGVRECLIGDFNLTPEETDNMLACLWAAGFKIVPLEEKDFG
jgi:hypothetical protein